MVKWRMQAGGTPPRTRLVCWRDCWRFADFSASFRAANQTTLQATLHCDPYVFPRSGVLSIFIILPPLQDQKLGSSAPSNSDLQLVFHMICRYCGSCPLPLLPLVSGSELTVRYDEKLQSCCCHDRPSTGHVISAQGVGGSRGGSKLPGSCDLESSRDPHTGTSTPWLVQGSSKVTRKVPRLWS